MKIVELRTGLSDLQRVLKSFGVTKQASELETLVEALAEFDELTIAELVKRIRAISVATKPKQPKSLNEAAVEDALRELRDSMHLSESFQSAVESVLKDSRLKKDELLELARRFGGSTPTKPTKAAMAAFLIERRLEMRRQGGLGATIDRMMGRTGT